MQGINYGRHKRLGDSLLQMEQLMSTLGYAEAAEEMKAQRGQMENSHAVYIRLLEDLSAHIFAYEELYTDIKVNTLGKKLAALKKMISPFSTNSIQLKETIANHYGT